MDSTSHEGRGGRRFRRAITSASVLAAACFAAALLIVLGGCGSNAPTSQPTTPPQSPAASSAAIAPVWAQVGNAGASLFGLTVSGAKGFSSSEQTYLRDVDIAWASISAEAADYAQLPDPGSSGAVKLAKKMGRQATVWVETASPSKRFVDLRDSVHALMQRLSSMAQLTTDYAGSQSPAEKTTLAGKVATLGAALPSSVGSVTDWGSNVRDLYGSNPYTPPPSPTTTASPTPSASASTQPTTSPTAGPTTSPTAKPKPSLTTAESTQITDMVALDSWLGGILDSANDTIAQPLPWDDAVVTSFCLNMGFVQNACDTWTARHPAGSRVTAGFDEYIKGLKVIRVATNDLTDAAQNSSAKSLKAGKAELAQGRPELKKGIAELKALK